MKSCRLAVASKTASLPVASKTASLPAAILLCTCCHCLRDVKGLLCGPALW